MSWIRYAVAGIALCAGASVASAQGGPPAGGPPMGGQQGQGRGRGMQAMLLEGITLTDVQQAKIDEVRAKYRTQMQSLMPNGMQGGPPDEGTRKKMSEMQEHQQHDIRELLNDDQRKVFDVNATAMKKRREEMQKQRQGQGR